MLAGEISRNIERLRLAKGWSRPDLGKRCNPPTSGQQIERLEKGQRELTVGWIERLSGALAVDPAELIVGESRQFELTPQVAAAVAQTVGRVALQGGEPSQAIVDDLAVILQELFVLFSKHEAMRNDPQAVKPVVELLTR